MPLTAAKARALGVELDADIDALVEAFDADLVQVWLRLRERIVELMNRLATKDGQVVSNQVNLGIARAVARELEQALQEAGFDNLIRNAVEQVGELGRYQGYGQKTVAAVEGAVGWSAQTLDLFYALKVAELLEVPRALIREFEQIVLQGVVGTSSRATLVNAMMKLLDVAIGSARTIYDTAATQFSQLVILSTSTGDPNELMLYTGPIDTLIRPFCLDLAGQVFSRTQISEMDNGQIPNVLISRGGYNCRHKWVPFVPLREEDEQKLGTPPFYADEKYKQEVAGARAEIQRQKDEKAARRAQRGR